MSSPQRIQLSRQKGWRMPENTVKVDRSTPWGNPFQGTGKTPDRAYLRELFREMAWRDDRATYRAQIRAELAGKNLACWCPPGEPCHADVLLEIANEGGRSDG